MNYEKLNKTTIKKCKEILKKDWFTDEEIEEIIEIIYQIGNIILEINWQKFSLSNYFE